MTTTSKAGRRFAVAYLSFVTIIGIGAVVGYVLNVFDVIRFAFSDEPFTIKTALHIVGMVVPPLGSVMGYF